MEHSIHTKTIINKFHIKKNIIDKSATIKNPA